MLTPSVIISSHLIITPFTPRSLRTMLFQSSSHSRPTLLLGEVEVVIAKPLPPLDFLNLQTAVSVSQRGEEDV